MFDFLGKWWIKCRCKHDHKDHLHNGKLGGCIRCSSCFEFYSPYTCSCGRSWDEHKTVIETKSERLASGKEVENLARGGGFASAAAGAVTSFSSLVPGVEREKLKLLKGKMRKKTSVRKKKKIC